MGKSDEEKFAELNEKLKEETTPEYKLKYSKDLLKDIKPEIEQLARWWNLKMDEFNFAKQKFEVKEDLSQDGNNWEIILYEKPTETKGLSIRIGRSIEGIDNWSTDYYRHYFDGRLVAEEIHEGGLHMMMKNLQTYLVNIMKESKGYKDSV